MFIKSKSHTGQLPFWKYIASGTVVGLGMGLVCLWYENQFPDRWLPVCFSGLPFFLTLHLPPYSYRFVVCSLAFYGMLGALAGMLARKKLRWWGWLVAYGILFGVNYIFLSLSSGQFGKIFN